MTKTYFSTRVAPSQLAQMLWVLRRYGEMTSIEISISGVATHPEDDLVLAAVATAQVDYLVTGDADLLALSQFGKANIVSAAAFVDILDAAAQPPTGEEPGPG